MAGALSDDLAVSGEPEAPVTDSTEAEHGEASGPRHNLAPLQFPDEPAGDAAGPHTPQEETETTQP